MCTVVLGIGFGLKNPDKNAGQNLKKGTFIVTAKVNSCPLKCTKILIWGNETVKKHTGK